MGSIIESLRSDKTSRDFESDGQVVYKPTKIRVVLVCVWGIIFSSFIQVIFC